jgi:DNA-binding NarL/FixJ family response regulator
MEDDRGLAGLVAACPPDQRIAEILNEQHLDIASFESAEALPLDAAKRMAAVIVIVEDTVPTPARLVEPTARRCGTVPIVALCARIERWEVRAALAAGATGVVSLHEFQTTLGPCLRAVRSGQTCVPRGNWRQIDPPALSSREKQILGLVVMGYMNGQIAEQLFLAESTVKSHLSSAFGKLGVRSRNEAVNLILDPERGLGMGILALGGERLEISSQGTP